MRDRDKAGIIRAVTLYVLALTATSALAQDKSSNTNPGPPVGNINSGSRRHDDPAATEIAPDSRVKPQEASSDLIKQPGDPTQTNNSTGTSDPPPTSAREQWQFQFTPYFWLAGQRGTSGVRERTALVDKKFTDGIHVLDFFFMGVFEARRDRFISLTDVEFVAVSGDRATPGPLFSGVKVDFNLVILDPEVCVSKHPSQRRCSSIANLIWAAADRRLRIRYLVAPATTSLKNLRSHWATGLWTLITTGNSVVYDMSEREVTFGMGFKF